jgi:hypothetical protein
VVAPIAGKLCGFLGVLERGVPRLRGMSCPKSCWGKPYVNPQIVGVPWAKSAEGSEQSSLIQLDNLPQVIADVGKMQKARRLSNFVPVAEQEKLIILKALAELDGDRLIAARMLGVDTAALYRKPSRELD